MDVAESEHVCVFAPTSERCEHVIAMAESMPYSDTVSRARTHGPDKRITRLIRELGTSTCTNLPVYASYALAFPMASETGQEIMHAVWFMPLLIGILRCAARRILAAKDNEPEVRWSAEALALM